MKGAVPLLFFITVSLMAQSSEPGPDVERFRPTEQQAWKLAERTRELGRIEESIAAMYGDLKLLGYISEDGQSWISMRTTHWREFEKRDSTLSEERVKITWKNGKPVHFVFRVRSATVRGLRTVRTIFSLDSVRQGSDVKEPDIHFITMESLPSGRGRQVYYILTAWDAPVITEQKRSYTDNGITVEYPVMQVRDPQRKIEVMNRLVDSYRYLERHLDYLIARSIRQELNDMQRYMPHS